METLFAHCDADGDGRINLDEFEQVVQYDGRLISCFMNAPPPPAAEDAPFGSPTKGGEPSARTKAAHCASCAREFAWHREGLSWTRATAHTCPVCATAYCERCLSSVVAETAAPTSAPTHPMLNLSAIVAPRGSPQKRPTARVCHACALGTMSPQPQGAQPAQPAHPKHRAALKQKTRSMPNMPLPGEPPLAGPSRESDKSASSVKSPSLKTEGGPPSPLKLPAAEGRHRPDDPAESDFILLPGSVRVPFILPERDADGDDAPDC